MHVVLVETPSLVLILAVSPCTFARQAGSDVTAHVIQERAAVGMQQALPLPLRRAMPGVCLCRLCCADHANACLITAP